MDIDEKGDDRGAPRSWGGRRRIRTAASLGAISVLATVGLGVSLAGPAVAATARRVVAGTVESVATTSFTVKSGAATITIDVSTTTKYLDHGVSAPTIATVTAGARVRVRGTEAGTDIVDASRIRVLPARPVAIGKVTSTASLASGSFTLTRGAATITVDVSSATTYLDHGVNAPTVATVVTGKRVEVWGTAAGTDTVDASRVRVLAARSRGGHRRGLDRGLARLRSSVATVHGTTARVPVSCSLSSCRGTIRLTVHDMVRVPHGKTVESRTSVLALGSASYDIGRNVTTDVLVHLDGAAVAALGHASGHRVLATATISGQGKSVTSSRLVLAG